MPSGLINHSATRRTPTRHQRIPSAVVFITKRLRHTIYIHSTSVPRNSGGRSFHGSANTHTHVTHTSHTRLYLVAWRAGRAVRRGPSGRPPRKDVRVGGTARGHGARPNSAADCPNRDRSGQPDTRRPPQGHHSHPGRDSHQVDRLNMPPTSAVPGAKSANGRVTITTKSDEMIVNEVLLKVGK